MERYIHNANMAHSLEKSKNRLSRDFWSRSIFDFCNTIGGTADMAGIAAGSTRSRMTDVVEKGENRKDTENLAKVVFFDTAAAARHSGANTKAGVFV
jgi:hypothetical protein